MKKPSKPWRRGSRLGPGLLDLAEGTLPRTQYMHSCCLCDAGSLYTKGIKLFGVKPLPGASWNVKPAICNACLVERGTGPYCAGCDKKLAVYSRQRSALPEGSAWRATMFVGGDVEVHVCGDRSEYGTDPKLQCKRKARRALSLCPGGCGDRAEPGNLCGNCKAALRRDAAMSNAEELRWTDTRVPRELAEVLGRAVCGRGSGEARVSRSYSDCDEIGAHLTDMQALALGEIGDALTAMVKRAKAQGFAEGNSFLTRLAKGELSMEDLNRRTTS